MIGNEIVGNEIVNVSSRYRKTRLLGSYILNLLKGAVGPYVPWWLSGKDSSCNAGDLGSIPGPGRSPGGGHSNPLQSACLEKPTDSGAWRAAVHRVS